MSDIANAIYKHLRTMAPHQLERLTAIQLKEAADEIARLRLTDAEREAIKAGIRLCEGVAGEANENANANAWAKTAGRLRELLDRLK